MIHQKKTQLVSLYFVYRPKKNAYITNITNDDQKYYAFVPTYGDESTAFQRHVISVVMFFYSNKLQSMLVDYAVTEMGCSDNYSDADPCAKNTRGNCISTFLLHISQYITYVKQFFYSNNYCQGIVEVILFKVRFQGYYAFCDISSFQRGSQAIQLRVRKI